jgi:type IV secretory pathway VirJ component
MTRRRFALAALAALASLTILPATLAAQGVTRVPPSLVSYDVHDLPLVEVPPPAGASAASRARTPAESSLVVLLSGDGDWADIDKGIADALSKAGAAVVGLKSRSYLQTKPRSPDSMARDVERIIRHYLPLWGRDRVILLGYSRGADFVPFVANRLPADLRSRVALLGMFGMENDANFEFHWMDVVRDTKRPSDLPVAPELARLRGTRMLCVYGSDEKDSACRAADPSLIERVERGGAHHFDKDYAGLGALVLQSLARH